MRAASGLSHLNALARAHTGGAIFYVNVYASVGLVQVKEYLLSNLILLFSPPFPKRRLTSAQMGRDRSNIFSGQQRTNERTGTALRNNINSIRSSARPGQTCTGAERIPHTMFECDIRLPAGARVGTACPQQLRAETRICAASCTQGWLTRGYFLATLVLTEVTRRASFDRHCRDSVLLHVC